MSLTRKEIFEKIYHSNSWHGQSRSGPGSDPQNTASYVHFVNNWLEKHPDCQSIVELGCGDWATTRLIHLPPKRSYLGIDIVPGVVSTNQELYQSDVIHFECSDFLIHPPPHADLLLMKDVLQHLPNDSVQTFLQNTLTRYRYAIITNDAYKFEERQRFVIFTTKRELQKPNIDIKDGDSRPLILEKEPFRLQFTEKFTYSVIIREKSRKLIFMKDILVWCNDLPRDICFKKLYKYE